MKFNRNRIKSGILWGILKFHEKHNNPPVVEKVVSDVATGTPIFTSKERPRTGIIGANSRKSLLVQVVICERNSSSQKNRPQ